MSDISRGTTFHDGDTVAASGFHALVDAATILPAFISAKSASAPSGPDSFVFYSTSSQSLKRCSLTQLIGAFPKGGANGTYALRRLGTLTGDAAAGNDSRFPAIISGIRKANQTSPDTVAKPHELSFQAHNLNGGTQIDWHAADLFYDTLNGDKTYTFSNVDSGRIITVALKTQGHNVNWPSLLGASPAPVGNATVCYFTFINTPLGTSGSVIGL